MWFFFNCDDAPNPAPEAIQKTVAAHDEQPGGHGFQTAPPAVCSICGTNNGVEIRRFQRTHTPGWVWLFLPVGILISGILALALQVKHTLSLPVCMKCYQRNSWAGVVSWMSIIVCIFLLFPMFALAVALNSGFVFLGGFGVIAAIAYVAGRFDRKANPRYTQFTKSRVEIDVPGQGRILVLDHTVPTVWAGSSSNSPATA